MAEGQSCHPGKNKTIALCFATLEETWNNNNKKRTQEPLSQYDGVNLWPCSSITCASGSLPTVTAGCSGVHISLVLQSSRRQRCRQVVREEKAGIFLLLTLCHWIMGSGLVRSLDPFEQWNSCRYHFIWVTSCGVFWNKSRKPRVSEKQSLSCTLVLLLFMPKAWAWIENTALRRLFGIPEGNRAGLQCHYLPRNNIHTYAHNR